jgi:hypothetical protein
MTDNGYMASFDGHVVVIHATVATRDTLDRLTSVIRALRDCLPPESLATCTQPAWIPAKPTGTWQTRDGGWIEAQANEQAQARADTLKPGLAPLSVKLASTLAVDLAKLDGADCRRRGGESISNPHLNHQGVARSDVAKAWLKGWEEVDAWLKVVRSQGAEARRESCRQSDNPYDGKSPEASAWSIGWHSGASPMSRGWTDSILEQGAAARRNGYHVSNNPFVDGSPMALAWNEGWHSEPSKDDAKGGSHGATQMGAEAKRMGVPVTSNPYMQGTDAANRWIEGWHSEP